MQLDRLAALKPARLVRRCRHRSIASRSQAPTWIVPVSGAFWRSADPEARGFAQREIEFYAPGFGNQSSR